MKLGDNHVASIGGNGTGANPQIDHPYSMGGPRAS